MIAQKIISTSLINVVRKFGEEIVVIAGDFNVHVRSNQENYMDQYGGSDYGIRNKEGEKILEFCTAKNMIVGNPFLKTKVSRL